MGGLGGADAWGLLPLDSRDQICCGPLLSTHTHVHGHGSRTHPDSQAWRPVDFLLSEHWKGTSDSSVFAFAPPVGPGKAGTWLYSCGSFEPCRFQRPACPPRDPRTHKSRWGCDTGGLGARFTEGLSEISLQILLCGNRVQPSAQARPGACAWGPGPAGMGFTLRLSFCPSTELSSFQS